MGVGNLVAVKRWDLFLAVVAQLMAAGTADGAVLIGGGPLENALKAQARELGIGHFVEFTGHMDRPAILERLAEGMILLHTAESEGQGYVFLEAQAQGLALVSTPVGMAHPSARWKIGEDVPALAAACSAFLTDGPDPDYQPDFIIEETVDAYLAYYQA
jgi:glycosyltransferase involved in cell wall biosynthesis